MSFFYPFAYSPNSFSRRCNLFLTSFYSDEAFDETDEAKFGDIFDTIKQRAGKAKTKGKTQSKKVAAGKVKKSGISSDVIDMDEDANGGAVDDEDDDDEYMSLSSMLMAGAPTKAAAAPLLDSEDDEVTNHTNTFLTLDLTFTP